MVFLGIPYNIENWPELTCLLIEAGADFDHQTTLDEYPICHLRRTHEDGATVTHSVFHRGETLFGKLPEPDLSIGDAELRSSLLARGARAYCGPVSLTLYDCTEEEDTFNITLPLSDDDEAQLIKDFTWQEFSDPPSPLILPVLACIMQGLKEQSASSSDSELQHLVAEGRFDGWDFAEIMDY